MSRSRSLWPSIIGAGALLALSIFLYPHAARSADIPSNERFTVASNGESYDWTGFNLGLMAGGGATVGEISGGPFTFDGIGGEGFLAGGYVGYDYQLGNSFVVGVIGDAAWTNIRSELSVPGFSAEAGPEYKANASVRLGYLVSERALAYMRGGYSYAHYVADWSGGSASQDYHGWHVGGGLEAFLNHYMTVGVDVAYTQYGGEDWGTGGAISVEPSEWTGTLRAGFHF